MADSLAATTGVQRLGDADPAARVEFEVALKLRNRADLDQRIARSESLSAADLTASHLPTQAAYDAVRDWLLGKGLTIEPTSDPDNHLAVRASGSVAVVGRALGVTFARVRSEGQDYVAAETDPTVPSALEQYVGAINGLQPYLHATKMGEAAGADASAVVAAATPDIIISGNYFPVGIERAYKGAPYLPQSGLGTTTAILIDTFPNASDVSLFYKKTGIGQSLSNITAIQTVPGTLPAASGEETIDVDWSSGIGYQAKTRIYATRTLLYTDLDAGLRAIIRDLGKGVAIDQLSISLGGCEEGPSAAQIKTDNDLLATISARRVTILVATGDSGAHECGPSSGLHPAWYSTSPYVTAVGGTHLVIQAASNTAKMATIKTETGWTGSGGGLSQLFSKPAFQAKLPYTARAVPDVAAVGDPATGVVIYLNGVQKEYGGTSVATPIWAGFIGWINQARKAAKKPDAGLLGPRLYPLLGTANFRDTVQGNNGGYAAKPGYDLVTGLGSPIMNKLLPTLVAQP